MLGGEALESCVGDLEVLLLLVRSVGSDDMLANTLNILITVYMTIGDYTKVLCVCVCGGGWVWVWVCGFTHQCPLRITRVLRCTPARRRQS